MKRAIYTGLVVMLVSALSACSSYNYYTAARNKTDLSSYRTFAWLPPETSNRAGGVVKKEIADERVKETAISALQKKGLRLQENNPDLLVSYSTVTGRGMKTEFYPAYYGGFGWGGWGWGWGYRPFWGGYYGGWGYPYGGFGGGGYARVPYKEGTIIIDIIDRNTRKLVWRGFGVGELHNPKRTLDELPKVVDGVLKQLELNQVNQMQIRKA
ncbi:DUF4136 domain-containing protein [Mucilaginibacter sabulilitoris]|uniref:DUF4136 domain-containing protein n=1 Tax=Mucilaginibacter sabulilitoris TaxID=1173583 RepID=A0ABZ0TTZ8_9SPHI|nr:DUF4136 domain-containing protein [Mucilaginibacter sabulilitoris]WPU96581.1 DUF4136 domain-containing protein [Mucilaginibacter sabulilitoris]